MRMIGLLGMIVLVGVGVLFSKYRTQIRPRVILWGIGLQFLFAVIILSESLLSWAGMFVFLVLILLYIFEDRFLVEGNWRAAILPGLGIILGSAVAVAASYGLDAIGLAAPFLGLLVLAGLLLHVTKHSQFVRYVFGGALVVCLGMLIQRGSYGQDIFRVLADQVVKFLQLSHYGAAFLFNNLYLSTPEIVKQIDGATGPMQFFDASTQSFVDIGIIFAFHVLPTIIFFSAIMSILYYLGIMQMLVEMMAKFMRWTMGTSGAETLSCSSNVFVGQTEAPLLIRPFLDEMTVSELHAVMVGGFATIAGGVLAAYISMGVDARYLIAASVMSAPAALVMAKIFLPEIEHSVTAGDVKMPEVKKADNLLDAAARGVTDGLKLAVNVGAMLIAFIALIELVDVIMGFLDKIIDGKILGMEFNDAKDEFRGIFPGSLKTLFGWIFAPLAYLMGVPWGDAASVGNLLGIKIAVNEFVAYAELSKHIAAADLSPKAIVVATYALCGFANFSSIGIQIGGIGALAPGRRSELARVALRAMFAGALASWMTATIAGMLL